MRAGLRLAGAALALAAAAAERATLLVANRGLAAVGTLEAPEADTGAVALGRDDAVALLQRLERTPPFDAPKRTLVLAVEGEPALEHAEAAMGGHLTKFSVDDGTALLDSFVSGTGAKLFCSEGVEHMSCQQWHAPVDGVLADVQGVSDGSVFVMPLDDARRLGGLVSEADLEETQVVVLSGHGIFEDEVVPRRAGRGRRLDDSGNSTEGYTQEEIDEFQVNLWTAVFLILLTLGAVMALVTMHVIPDSLLYAKFQADVSGFKDD